MPTHRRGIFATAFASLAFGALTTIAIAWALACADIHARAIVSSQQIYPARGPVERNPLGGPEHGISVRICQDRGRLVANTSCFGPNYLPRLGTPNTFDISFVKTPPDELVPASVNSMALPWLNGLEWPRGDDEDWREIQASGWPFLAMASEYRRAANFTYQQLHGIKIPYGKPRQVGSRLPSQKDRVLPLRPLFPGFVVDTLVFACMWGSIIWIPGSIRRMLRHRRGLCPRCAYDLRATAPGAPCPECGNAQVRKAK